MRRGRQREVVKATLVEQKRKLDKTINYLAHGYIQHFYSDKNIIF